jgi:hypothetical protein
MFTLAVIRPVGHNVGNEAINFALRHMLSETFGRLVSIVDYPATNKHGGGSSYGLTSESIHGINRYADGVIVGGGNLFENDEIVVDNRALKALQPPLMLFSNSRGRIFDRRGNLSNRSDVISDEKLTGLLERADISLSRDSATHRHLRLINEKDRLGWCPTINVHRYSQLLPVLPEKEEVGALISIRTPGLMNVPFRFQSNVQNHIESVIDRLRSNGHKRVRILCNDSRDLDFATTFRYTKGADSIYSSDVYQYLSLLKNADILVSYRLHATLPAMSFGVPTVNIAYDERAMSLFDDLGLQSAYINMVEKGDDFADKLLGDVDKGGFLLSESTDLVETWNKISTRQFEQMSQFRDMVAHYVHSGAAES